MSGCVYLEPMNKTAPILSSVVHMSHLGWPQNQLPSHVQHLAVVLMFGSVPACCLLYVTQLSTIDPSSGSESMTCHWRHHLLMRQCVPSIRKSSGADASGSGAGLGTAAICKHVRDVLYISICMPVKVCCLHGSMHAPCAHLSLCFVQIPTGIFEAEWSTEAASSIGTSITSYVTGCISGPLQVEMSI